MKDTEKAAVESMFDFFSRVEGEWARRTRRVAGKDSLSQRDLALVYWVIGKREVPFSDAMQYVCKIGKDGSLSSPSAAAAVIARIAKRGILKTERTFEDDRKKTVSITPKGKRLAQTLLELRGQLHKDVAECLKPGIDQHHEQLTALFLRALKNLEE